MLSVSPPESWKRLKSFADRACDGDLAVDESGELIELLRSDETNRAWYVSYLRLNAWLDYDSTLAAGRFWLDGVAPAAGQADGDVAQMLGIERDESLSRYRPAHAAPYKTRSAVAASLAAAVLFYGTFVIVSWNLRSGALPSGNDGNDFPIGMVSNMADARWSSDGASKTNADPVRSGEPLKLEVGLVELKLNSGVTLLVEGPAEWTIDGKNAAKLRTGKLVAKVPGHAIGFTLNTPTAKIVDLGTEFGVDVDRDGKTALHVLDGAVEYTSQARHPVPKQLTAGKAIQIDGEGAAYPIEANPDRFASIRLGSRRAKPPAALPDPERRRAAEEYAAFVRKSHPYCHWTFEFGKVPGGVPDSSENGQNGWLAGGLTPAAFEPGKFGQAVRLHGKTQRVEVANSPVLHRTFQAFSLSLWIKPQHAVPEKVNLIVGKCGGQSGDRGWALRQAHRGELVFYYFDDHRSDTGSSHFRDLWTAPLNLATHEFSHVAVVYQASTSLRIYVGGRLVAEQVDPDSVLSQLDSTCSVPLNLGHRGDKLESGFEGVIDEVILYDRALSPKEVRLHPSFHAAHANENQTNKIDVRSIPDTNALSVPQKASR